MERRLRERVRWGNVGRAVAVAGVVGLVVAWPRLAPDAPRVPGGRVVPVATPSPRPSAPPPVVRTRKRPVVRRERRAGEEGEDPRSRRRRRRARAAAAPAGRGRDARPARMPESPTAAPPARPAPAEPTAPAPGPAPPAQGAPAPPDPDPVLREFGPEGP